MRQCEPESGDIPDMAELSRDRGIPFLSLDIDLQAEESASAKMRIEAFVEMAE
jgi:benzoyl-CoA reductase/2-hydroxyglutaryl-CoA dehydratase subunit BcrC/BadD/HgdB